MEITAFYKRFRKALAHKPRKSTFSILHEYIWVKLTKPSIAEQYFIKYLFRKDAGNIYEYLNTHQLNDKFWNINNPSYIPVMDCKHIFEGFFSQNQIPVAKTLAYSYGVFFFKNDKILLIDSQPAFMDFIQSLPTNKALFIKKNRDSFGGKNIFKIHPDERTDVKKLNTIYQQVTQSEYIYQEEVIQHSEMNRLNPTCVNTVRFVTYTNKNRESKILAGMIRTSLRDMYTDNISSGGGCVRVDLEKGVLDENLYTDLEKGPGIVYQTHPFTGITIKDFKIPYLQEAKAVALRGASLISNVILAGWDIAIGAEGPVLIEVNKSPDLDLQEVGQKGFRKNPVYNELLKEH
jgi:hypothetical protein